MPAGTFREMRSGAVMAAVALGLIAGAARAGERSTVLWRRGADSVWAVPCPSGHPGFEATESCTALIARHGGQRRLLGGGYIPLAFHGVSVLWRGQRGRAGPDVVVLGQWGGSAGLQDVYAVSFRPGTSAQKIEVQMPWPVKVTTSARGPILHLAVGARDAFASVADTVEVDVPLRWSGARFEADITALTHRCFDVEDMGMREVAMRRELAIASQPDVAESFRSRQTTLRALLGLVLSGRAVEAHRLLLRAWPDAGAFSADGLRARAEAEAFWSDLCWSLVGNPLWRDVGLSRLPDAKVIEAAARAHEPAAVAAR